MGKVSRTRGMCICGVICLKGEGQLRTMKHDLDACLSSPRIRKTGLMLTFITSGDLLLMSFMKFSHTFHNLSSMRLSQFNSDTEKFVPDGFQKCSKMNTTSYGLVKWTSGRLLGRGDRQACATSGYMPESQWGLWRKINMLYLVVTLKLFG
jgi:hypothetical protein